MREPGQVLAKERELAEAAKAKKEAKIKIKNYEKYVRQAHQPKISSQKVNEMSLLREKVSKENTATRAV